MRYRVGLKVAGKVAGVVLGMACAAALQAAPGNPVAGATVFKKCTMCHNVDPSGRNGLGPNLRGVVGRPAGSVAGFTYSPAMKAAARTWNDKTLAAFLASPKQAVPGTKMMFVGLANPQDQADVIAYLKQNGAAKK